MAVSPGPAPSEGKIGRGGPGGSGRDDGRSRAGPESGRTSSGTAAATAGIGSGGAAATAGAGDRPTSIQAADAQSHAAASTIRAGGPGGPPELDRFSIPCIRWQVYARAVTATGSDQLQGRRATPLRVAVRSRCCADRLRAAGKRPEVMIVAVMRKLLLLAWALLRSGTPFSPTYAQGARWAAD